MIIIKSQILQLKRTHYKITRGKIYTNRIALKTWHSNGNSSLTLLWMMHTNTCQLNFFTLNFSLKKRVDKKFTQTNPITSVEISMKCLLTPERFLPPSPPCSSLSSISCWFTCSPSPWPFQRKKMKRGLWKKKKKRKKKEKKKKEKKKKKKGNVINRKNGSTDKRTKEQVLEFAVFPNKGWCSPTCTSSITSPPPSP